MSQGLHFNISNISAFQHFNNISWFPAVVILTFFGVRDTPISPHVTGLEEELKILFTFEPSYQNKSCSECQQDVGKTSKTSKTRKLGGQCGHPREPALVCFLETTTNFECHGILPWFET